VADRTVTTRLKLGIDGWTVGSRAVKKDLRDLNTSFKETAGFATGFRKKLEEATARLPKIEIDANSSPAEAKFAQLRGELERLSQQEIGVDVDAVDALAELDRLKRELAGLEDGASFEIRAGIQQAIADMETVAAEARRLDGKSVRIEIDADTKKAAGDIAKIQAGLVGLGVAVPVLASVTAGAVVLQGALFSASAGAKAFGMVATATFERVQEAVDSQDYSKLSPEEFQLAQRWQEFSDVYLQWQQSLNPAVIPAITGGLGLMEQTLPKISPLVAGTANSFVGLEQRAAAALDGPFWTKFLHNVGVAGPQAMTGLGNSTLNVVTGVAGIINAFLPWQGTVVGGLEDATAKFATWGQTLESNPQFQEFMADVEEHAPEVWALVKNLASALFNVGEAVVPLGVGSMAGINLLASIVAGMDPDHIRAIALAILAVKTAQAGLQVANFWQDLTGKLGGLSGAADTASGKMSGLNKVMQAGGMAALVAGAAIAVDALGDELAGLNPDIDELSKHMADLTAKGTPASEMLYEFGHNANTFAGDMGRSSVWFAPVIGQFEQLHGTVSRLASDNGLTQFSNDVAESMSVLYSVDSGRQRLENFDKTLTAMVQSGNTQQAAALFNELAKQSGLSADQVDKLRSLLPGYSAAAAAAQQATAPTGDALKDLGSSATGAATSVDTLRGALGQLTGLTASAMQAEIGYQDALDQATAAAKANGEAISTNTIKGRDNRSALIDLAKSANDYRQALIDQGTPLAEVEAKLGGQRAAFMKVAESMGFSRKQAEELATKLGLIPGNVKTDVKTPGGKEALDLIKEYERKLKELDGKTVTTTVRQVHVQKQENLKAARGGVFAFAAGGIHDAGIERMAVGGMRPQPPTIVSRPTVLFGEGSSGRGAIEAYIPYESQFRDRAIDILAKVASDFGFGLYGREADQQVQQVAVTVSDAASQLGAGLGMVDTSLMSTMGDTGTLTAAIADVGAVGESMTAGWQAGTQQLGDSVTSMGDQIGESISNVATVTSDGVELVASSVDVLSGSVQDLLMALAAGKASSGSSGSSKSSAKGGKSKGGSGYLLEPMDTVRGGAKGKKGKGGISATLTPMNTPRKPPGGMIEGDYGLSGTPDWTPGAYSAITSGGAPVNSSQVSAPQTAMPRPAPTAGGAESGGGSASGGRSPSGGIHVPITMNGVTVRQEADIPKIGSAVGFTLLSRGNV
jgi:hypothetical protein